MLIKIFLITCVNMASAIELSPGKPVPHADQLQKILDANNVKYTNAQERSLLDYLFNPNATNTSDIKDSSENMVNLDINVLDPNNLNKIVTNARKWWHRAARYTWYDKNEASYYNPHLTGIAVRQMQQSVYATRFRIMSTAHIRKHFIDQTSYQIAILVGSLNQIILKMENLYAQMYNFPRRTHFIWYLIIYEKILAGHVDVGYMVKKIFELNTKDAQKYNV